ncbi:MAG: ribosomal protein [Myxococcales bacterium]|nr:ribosomal protein [Myxococcales bacterium]
MAMQVILKEDVHNLGKAGELVKVKPGFGRNFLIPQGKAIVATAANVKQIEHEKKVIAAKQATLSKDAQAVADKLGSVEVQIERQAGEEDKLFGSVTGRDIADALKEKGVTIDHRKIVMGEPIKTIGYHTLDIKLGSNVTGKIKVVVVPKTA